LLTIRDAPWHVSHTTEQGAGNAVGELIIGSGSESRKKLVEPVDSWNGVIIKEHLVYIAERPSQENPDTKPRELAGI